MFQPQRFIFRLKYFRKHILTVRCEWNQQTHWIPILLVLLLYMFRAAFLPIIRSSWPYISIGTFYAVLMSVCYQEQDATAFHPAPDSKRPSKLHKMYQCWCTAKNSWWWAERLPETCRVVIPIKLESSVSVGFIHKEFVMIHGHTILKYLDCVWMFYFG